MFTGRSFGFAMCGGNNQRSFLLWSSLLLAARDHNSPQRFYCPLGARGSLLPFCKVRACANIHTVSSCLGCAFVLFWACLSAFAASMFLPLASYLFAVFALCIMLLVYSWNMDVLLAYDFLCWLGFAADFPASCCLCSAAHCKQVCCVLACCKHVCCLAHSKFTNQ